MEVKNIIDNIDSIYAFIIIIIKNIHFIIELNGSPPKKAAFNGYII